MKKLLFLLPVLILTGFAVAQIESKPAVDEPEKKCCDQFVDKNNDKVCDFFTDMNQDGKCDHCTEKCHGTCTNQCHGEGEHPAAIPCREGSHEKACGKCEKK